jgi:hypothetical protein
VEFPQNKLEEPGHEDRPVHLSPGEVLLRLKLLSTLLQLRQIQEGLRVREKVLLERLSQVPAQN